MPHEVLYRKYRPADFDEVIGQDAVVKALKGAIANNAVAHAYLFAGSRGIGKTSIARIFAREIGTTPNDIYEIDAASNRGIDDIRALRDAVAVLPFESRFKVYIIDEVHMLTKEAFNALLKTLEEPPKHAVIILATTEYEKLPATITSRAQRFVFKKLSKAVIMGKLAMEAKAEKIKIDEDALELVAASAEGSVRDAESLLDQIASFTEKITLADVERITGRTGLKKIAEFADLLIKKDLQAAVAHVNALADEGGNPVQFTKDLIHYLRKVLSLKLSPALEKTFEKELTKDEIATAKRLGTASDAKLLVQLIKSLIRAYSEMRYSPFAIVPLEIALTENLS